MRTRGLENRSVVATVFYLISLGLFELFIAKASLPGWVETRNLDYLKTKLLGLTLSRLGREQEAIACFEKVRELSGMPTVRDIVR